MSRTALERGIFADGSYADVFQPDAPADPFHALYRRKRDDVLACLAALPPGSGVLDLGGGPGRVAVPLARIHLVTLCDISDRMLSIAVESARAAGVRDGNLVVRQLDAREPLPFASNTFTAAVALDLLVHLPDPGVALRELRRVLQPGGQVLVDMTNSNPLWTLRYPRYVGRRPGRWVRTLQGGGVLPEWQSIVTHHTRAAFDEMLHGAGLQVEKRWQYGPAMAPKWFLVLARPRATGTSAQPLGTTAT